MKRIMWTTAALALVSVSLAQAPKDAPHLPSEPKSAAGAGQAWLAKFAGDWDVVKTFHPRQGEPIRGEGRCHQELVHGGLFLQSDFAFGAGAGETTGRGLIGFEPETGAFTSVWIDSRQTRMSLRRSREPFDGTKIVLYSEALGGDARDDRRSKTVSTLEDDGRRLIHRQYALGPGGSERLMMSLEMSRKPGKPAPPR